MRIMLFAAGGDIGGGKTHILSLAGGWQKRSCGSSKGVLSMEAREMGIDTVDVDSGLGTFTPSNWPAPGRRISARRDPLPRRKVLGILSKIKGIPVSTPPAAGYLGA